MKEYQNKYQNDIPICIVTKLNNIKSRDKDDMNDMKTMKNRNFIFIQDILSR